MTIRASESEGSLTDARVCSIKWCQQLASNLSKEVSRDARRRSHEDGRGLKVCKEVLHPGLCEESGSRHRASMCAGVLCTERRSRFSTLTSLHGIELDKSKRAPMSPLSSPTYNLQTNDPRPLQGTQLSIG